MATLTKCRIQAVLGAPDRDERLIVTPLLDPEKQIGDCGIDLRLNNQFIVFRGRAFRSLDPAQPMQIARFSDRNPELRSYRQVSRFLRAEADEAREQVRRYQEKVVVPFGNEFVLHPGQLALGSSFEYISVPKGLEAQVEGRSSWARLGLVVASASTVEPGFQGVVTLELSNLGTVPLVLYPGMRVACLVLHRTEGTVEYSGDKYVWPIGPEFSKLYKDADMERWLGGPRIELLADMLAKELVRVHRELDACQQQKEDENQSGVS